MFSFGSIVVSKGDKTLKPFWHDDYSNGLNDMYTIINPLDILTTVEPQLLLRDTGDKKDRGSKLREGGYYYRETFSLAFNGGVKHTLNRYGDTGDPHIMFTLFDDKMPTEPKSLFDDDMKELLYGWTKTYIRTNKSAIAWKDKMTHVEGTTSYFDKNFDY